MTKLIWDADLAGGSRWMPSANVILVTRQDIQDDWAPAALSHELAHRKMNLRSLAGVIPADESFWRELLVWEQQFKRGLDKQDVPEGMLGEALGSYLEAVADEFGEDSSKYKMAKRAYDLLKRKYLND